jgi:hypothetical protein
MSGVGCVKAARVVRYASRTNEPLNLCELNNQNCRRNAPTQLPPINKTVS